MSIIICGYKLGPMIGSGAHGAVYLGERIKDGLKVCIKFSLVEPDYLANEYNTLMKLRDINGIVKVLDYISPNDRMFVPNFICKGINLSYSGAIVLEYDEKYITLSSYIKNNKFDEAAVKKIFLNIVYIMWKCECKKIINYDLKPGNILIDPNTLDIKIIDFSVSRESNTSDTRELNDYKTIVRLIGIILYKMVYNDDAIYYDDEYMDLFIKPSSYLNDMISRCINKNQECRPSLRWILDGSITVHGINHDEPYVLDYNPVGSVDPHD
jgi:serine/threonine protein kinase